MTGDQPQPPVPGRARLRISLGSTLLLITAVLAVLTAVSLFNEARRPLGWVLAASFVAWLLSAVIALLDRWVHRGVAIVLTALGFVLVAGGTWVALHVTLQVEADRLRSALPQAAQELEHRYSTAAQFHLADRTQAFVNQLDQRYGARAQVEAALGTAATYVVTGVLMLFLVGYGPRFVSGALRQIADPGKRAVASAVVYGGSGRARAYLLYTMGQAFAVTGLCTGVFYLLDLPAPFVLGVLVGLLGTIPYLGIVLGGIAPLIAAAISPTTLTYPALLVLLIGLQAIEALVIRPWVDDRSLHIGPTIMLVGALVGFELYGFGGAVYGEAILVLGWALVDALPERTDHP